MLTPEEQIKKRREDENLTNLEAQAQLLRCTCGGSITVAWLEGAYRLRCGRGRTHDKFLRRGDSVIERFEARQDAPKEVLDLEIEEYKTQENRRRGMKELTNGSHQTSLEQYRGQTSFSKADAMEVLRLIHPKLPEDELFKAALLCAAYKLNPLPAAKHLFIVPFWDSKEKRNIWVQFVGIRATRLQARRAAMRYHNPYGYADESPRIMTEAEQIKANGKIDNTRICAITILEDKHGLKTYGIGAWGNNETLYGADKGNTPENMAKIRSERNALDKLFPGEIVRDIEVVDEGYMGEPVVISPSVRTLSEENPRGSLDFKDEGGSGAGIEKSKPPATGVESIPDWNDILRTQEVIEQARLRLDLFPADVKRILGVPTPATWLKTGHTAEDAVALLEAEAAKATKKALD